MMKLGIRVFGVAWVALLIGLAGGALAPVAHAQPANGDEPAPSTNEDEAARLLFMSAREAFAAGDYERALQGFQQAYDLSQRPALLYNIGTALDRLRRDEEALAIFEQFLREDPETPNRAEIESRVRQLRANVEAARAREEAARLEAERVEQERLAAEEERRRAEQERRAAEEAAEGGISPMLTIGVGGLAVAAGALGMGFGLRTRSLNDSYLSLADSLDMAGGTPTSDQLSELRSRYNKAKSRQTLTNVFLPIAGAAAIGAVVMVFFTDWDGDSPPAASEPSARLTPSLGVSRLGLDLGMTYEF